MSAAYIHILALKSHTLRRLIKCNQQAASSILIHKHEAVIKFSRSQSSCCTQKSMTHDVSLDCLAFLVLHPLLGVSISSILVAGC